MLLRPPIPHRHLVLLRAITVTIPHLILLRQLPHIKPLLGVNRVPVDAQIMAHVRMAAPESWAPCLDFAAAAAAAAVPGSTLQPCRCSGEIELVHISLYSLQVAGENKAPHAAGLAKVEMQVAGAACIIPQPRQGILLLLLPLPLPLLLLSTLLLLVVAAGRRRSREEQEIMRRRDGTDVEMAHLVACSAVAPVELLIPHRQREGQAWIVWVRKCEVNDVLDVVAVA